jgi:hypothetical protein
MKTNQAYSGILRQRRNLMLATDMFGRFSVFGIGRLSSFCMSLQARNLANSDVGVG